MKYQGSCHCGAISYEVEADIKEVMECNCSICQRRGHLLVFVPRDRLKLKTPESKMAAYTFNKHLIKHRFCPVCGCGPFGEGKDPKGNVTAAINVRCLDDVDLTKLKDIPAPTPFTTYKAGGFFDKERPRGR